jgi:bifunctional UDP-N-acetylglucosamine pyrophosphorylase/glucosamine-1-phosphate N-acetyltransferase
VAVLAAGQGTRMRSHLPKVLHELAGRPVIDHVLDVALACASPGRIVVVIGHEAEAVRDRVERRGVRTALQERLLGTGDAVRVALQASSDLVTDGIVVLSGDVPLLRSETVRRLQAEVAAGAAAALLTAELPAPSSYGRILRRADGTVAGVVEARDATPEELTIREVNAGCYAALRAPLEAALAELTPDNVQGEYYLTDVPEILAGAGHRVVAVALQDADEMHGVNTRADLARAAQLLNRRVVTGLMAAGVTVLDPATTWVDPRSELARDVVLEPGVALRGRCMVGREARIGAHSVLEGVEVAPGEHIPPLTYRTR